MSKEHEEFWEMDAFAVVTDGTKPAMKWTVKELVKQGKQVHTVDMSDKPLAGSLSDVSELPDGIQGAVIGVTRTRPEDVMEALENKGINRIWVHWMTDTPGVKERCANSQVECLMGRCPMMYLGSAPSIHSLHRGIMKLIGKY